MHWEQQTEIEVEEFSQYLLFEDWGLARPFSFNLNSFEYSITLNIKSKILGKNGVVYTSFRSEHP